MNLIPYLRFTWATIILIRLFTQTSFVFDTADIFPILIDVIGGLFMLTFSAYCIITGMQELKQRQIIEAKYFDIFGLFFQIIIFLTGLYLLKTYFGEEIDLLTIGLLIVWQVGLLLLIFVDTRRIWTN